MRACGNPPAQWPRVPALSWYVGQRAGEEHREKKGQAPKRVTRSPGLPLDTGRGMSLDSVPSGIASSL